MSAIVLGLIAAASWGFHDFCVRFISQKVPISACITVVFVAGLLFQIVLILGTGRIAPVPTEAFAPIVGAGIAFAIANFGLYGAFQRGPVWLAAPLVACFSVIAVGWSALDGAAIMPMQWLAVLAILFGIAIVAILSDDTDDSAPAKGPTVFYALVAAVAFSTTFKFGQAVTELSNEMMSALATRLIAIVTIVSVFVALRLPFWPGKKNLWLLGIMGIADGIAILAVVSAGGLRDAQYAAVATSMYGLPTIWLASMFLKERINLKQWIGCIVAFAGVGYLAV